MVNNELSEAITEVLDILNNMDKEYVNMIPDKFKTFLKENKSNTYIPNLDHSKKLNEMVLKEKTKDILAIICMKYWYSSDERKKYVETLNEN